MGRVRSRTGSSCRAPDDRGRRAPRDVRAGGDETRTSRGRFPRTGGRPGRRGRNPARWPYRRRQDVRADGESAIHRTLGCHRPRIADRAVSKQAHPGPGAGATYEKVADSTCSAAATGRGRDEWIAAGVFTALEQTALERLDGLESWSVAAAASRDGPRAPGRIRLRPARAHHRARRRRLRQPKGP